MKTRYIVTYDISDPDRLRRVQKTMKGAGEPLQFSVFECDLSDREREELILDLSRLIDAHADQVLFIDLGPAEGRAATCIASLGRPYVKRDRQAIVL